MSGNAFIQALARYFPNGLPDDDTAAIPMVREAIEHLLLAPLAQEQPGTAQEQPSQAAEAMAAG